VFPVRQAHDNLIALHFDGEDILPGNGLMTDLQAFLADLNSAEGDGAPTVAPSLFARTGTVVTRDLAPDRLDGVPGNGGYISGALVIAKQAAFANGKRGLLICYVTIDMPETSETRQSSR
jgi:hypothetical protein